MASCSPPNILDLLIHIRRLNKNLEACVQRSNALMSGLGMSNPSVPVYHYLSDCSDTAVTKYMRAYLGAQTVLTEQYHLMANKAEWLELAKQILGHDHHWSYYKLHLKVRWSFPQEYKLLPSPAPVFEQDNIV